MAPADLFEFIAAQRWCWAGCVVARWSDCGSRICSRRTGGCSSPMARAVLWEPVELPVDQRPETASDALFVVLKGARAGAPLSINGLEQIVASAKTRAGSSTDASPIVVCVAVQTKGNDVGAARSPVAQGQGGALR